MNKTNHNLTKGKQMISEDKLIETTSEIADMILRLKFGQDYDKKCIVFNDDNTTEYNKDAQDIFNDIYDNIEHLILEDYININEIVFN